MYNHQHADTGNVQLQCRSTARVLGRHTSPPEFLKDHLHPNEVSSNQTQECDSDENKYPPCQLLISSHLLLFISHSESTKTVSVSLLMTHSVSFLLLCFVFLFIFFLHHCLCFQHILTFPLFMPSSFSHVLFPFHSSVILFCATSTPPTYMPPTERKKCTHTCRPPVCAPFNTVISSFSLVIPCILCPSAPPPHL